jgi:hypothetical protein
VAVSVKSACGFVRHGEDFAGRESATVDDDLRNFSTLLHGFHDRLLKRGKVRLNAHAGRSVVAGEECIAHIDIDTL